VNTTTTSNIRHRPAWQINRLMRRNGIRQRDIAKELRCSQAMVSKVIQRQVTASTLSERIWAAIERGLAAPAAVEQ
jgi:predicted transcriptional regulator